MLSILKKKLLKNKDYEGTFEKLGIYKIKLPNSDNIKKTTKKQSVLVVPRDS